jgi:cytochrome oxidase Cu insertion factor (SCO1/SenC/PrrC family)
MDEQEKARRKKIAALTVILPVLAGIAIVVAGNLFGQESTEKEKKPAAASRQKVERTEAANPTETGSPAPRVRLEEPASGKEFDSASLGTTPYAVVFISTKCDAAGKFLGEVAEGLEGGLGAILAITSAPEVDTPKAVREFLAKQGIPKGAPFHYLVGSESEVHGFWNAWGFNGPVAKCGGSIPAHLVGSSKGNYVNTGILDVDPQGEAELMTESISSLDH